MVLVEPLPHRPGSLQSLPVQVGAETLTELLVYVVSMSHIVDSCLQTKFEGGLTILHEAEEDAVNWLNSVTTTALAK